MKKHNENDGGARDLDVLLQGLKERYDAREYSGIYASEEEFKRRFFQAAHAQERPHFPMIWKAAAGIAVCLLAFQLVLTTLKDDSSAVRADGYGVPGVDMVAEAPVSAGYGMAMEDAVTEESEPQEMLLASAYTVEAGGAETDEPLLDAGFSGPMLRAALAVANDEDVSADREEASQTVSSFALNNAVGGAPAGGMGGFGGAAVGGMGGFGGGAAPAGAQQPRMGMTRMMTTDAVVAQKNAVASESAENNVRTMGVLARNAQPERAAAVDALEDAKEESAPRMKTAAVQTLAAAGQTKGVRTMNETQDLYLRPRPRPFVEPRVILPPIRILPPPRPADPKLVPVVVSEVSAKVRIRGEIASTEFEAVVTNPNRIALEGEFTLPLPAGATVTGAALDINGKMIDASIVEK